MTARVRMTLERRVLRIEMLDSYNQEKKKDERKVRQDLAHIRAIRNIIRAQGATCQTCGRTLDGWQWTLTSPSKLTPRRGLTKEDRIRIFGYDEPKRWGYERAVEVEEEGSLAAEELQ